ncbi:MAG: hypothetical protein Q8M88_10230 [Phenylobacterium sp.]|nr:hypothetical protein [Phenylobacterium sp.]MDP3174799.1 hypothetical protein [Phenylobacterium sp.]
MADLSFSYDLMLRFERLARDWMTLAQAAAVDHRTQRTGRG